MTAQPLIHSGVRNFTDTNSPLLTDCHVDGALWRVETKQLRNKKFSTARMFKPRNGRDWSFIEQETNDNRIDALLAHDNMVSRITNPEPR